MLAMKSKNHYFNVDPRQGQWIDPLIVNFNKQVLINGQYNSRTNYWRVNTAFTALALQGLESRDSHKGFKTLGQVQTTTKTQ